MESLLVSTGVVALAEIGDKTQLLSLMLAARYRKPLPIIAGIFVATIVNHLHHRRGFAFPHYPQGRGKGIGIEP